MVYGVYILPFTPLYILFSTNLPINFFSANYISISITSRRTNMPVFLVLMLMLMSTQFSLVYTCACACAYAYALVKTKLTFLDISVQEMFMKE